MAQTASGLNADQVNQADTLRTNRAFVGFLSSILGVDQTYSSDDAVVGNAPGQYIIANPDGSYSAYGQSRSNLQGGAYQTVTQSGQQPYGAAQPANVAMSLTPTMLVVGGLLLFLVLKGKKG